MPDFETSQLDALARDFLAAPAKVIPAIMPSAVRAANNMKRTLKKDSAGHSHLPGLASKVEYDIATSPTSITIEVGFRDEGQGELAGIAAFGSVNSAPVLDVTRGLTEEAPKFAAWAARLAAGVI